MPVFYKPSLTTTLELPLFATQVRAGFPSPAEEHSDVKLDLNHHLIAHPNSTFFVNIDGESMIGEDIRSGDIAIVDRSLEARTGDIVLAVVDGEFTIKRLEIIAKNGPISDETSTSSSIRLVPANPLFEPIVITENMTFQIWGVVTYTIHKTK